MTLLAAVSGGADSVALLCGLALLRDETKFQLHAVHVEHGLRGAASLEDAEFVRKLCERLEIPLSVRHAELEGGMDSAGVEERARNARQQFFARTMNELHADALLTAHHQDDQAETVLMRLLRGAGTQGLGGMREATPFAGGLLLRPFLHLPSEALRLALSQMGQTWCEDESNAEACCLRNQLRLQVFPLLSALQPQVVAHMAKTAERMQCDEDFLHSLAEALLDSARCPWPHCYALRWRAISGAPKPVALRALRVWTRRGFGLAGRESTRGEKALSYEDSLRLYALVMLGKPKSMNLPQGLRVTRNETFVHLAWQDGRPLLPEASLPPETIRACQCDYRFGTLRFTLAPCISNEALPNGQRAVFLTDALLAQELLVRVPQKGDWLQPFGVPGGKALRRYLTDRKVDMPFRSSWPILARGSEVLWVAGVGASEKLRIPENGGERLWKLSVEGELPFETMTISKRK